jgi:hypothetical protein
METRFVQAPLLLLAGTVALVVATPRGYAAEGAVSDPCDAVVASLREVARNAPFHARPVRFDFRDEEPALEHDLRWVSSPSAGAIVTRVTPACRAETRRGAAPAAVAAARALTEMGEPRLVDYGRRVLCVMQDPGSTHELQAWIDDDEHPMAQAVCIAELATWPDAEQQRQTIFAGRVRRIEFAWEVDPAFVAVANVARTPELLDLLVPVLADAHAHQARGYDRLRAAVCAPDDTMSADRVRACAALPAQAEHEWSRTGARPWVIRGAMTALYGGTVALSYAARDQAVSRGFATGAGVAGGILAGAAAAYCGGKAAGYSMVYPHGWELGLPASIVGGVLGGLAAHAIAAQPGARAPVTAIGLAPWYLVALHGTFE